ncbi:MAG TPA: hypothetical protein VL418_13910 [Devosiaceae bacterium]|nr:hypothetical protein [Devosiaceae bacterium]
MNTSVATPPNGVGIAPTGDHRQQRYQQERSTRSKARAPAEADEDGAGIAHTPAPPTDEPLVPAETLFATALFASALLRMPPSAREISLRANHSWHPPESTLRLRDKII